jgi:hypothetical protein
MRERERWKPETCIKEQFQKRHGLATLDRMLRKGPQRMLGSIFL